MNVTVPPPTLERHGPAAAAPLEVLFKEARRRRRRRWVVGGAAVALALAGVATGFGFAGTGNRHPQPAPHPHRAGPGTPSGPAARSVAPSAPTSPDPESVTFFNPTDGYGLFERGTGASCVEEVARTRDGGGQFAPLVRLPGCKVSKLAFDNHGDGFAYGPDLYVTHNSGASWSKITSTGVVLSVDALGNSVWMLEATCTSEATASTPATTCRPRVVESADGGRRWAPSQAQPAPPGVPARVPSAVSTGSLVRVSATSAYVVGTPARTTLADRPTMAGRAVPLWLTTDGGRTWTSESVPCGRAGDPLPTAGAVVSAAPDGTLFAMCGYLTQVGGQQDKAIFVSTDAGASWFQRGSCFSEARGTCADPALEGGYLGLLNGVSATTAFELGQRGGVLETTDGGSSWNRWEGVQGETMVATGPAALVFFDPSRGVVLTQTRIWHTADGGRTWTPVGPVASATTAPATSPCAASQLRERRGPGRRADGHTLDVFLLTNTGSACTLSGLPLVFATSTAGQRVAIQTGGGTWFGTLLPTVLSRGQQGEFWIEQTANSCTGTTALRLGTVVLDLPGRGGEVTLSGLALTPACGIGGSRVGVPPRPSGTPGA